MATLHISNGGYGRSLYGSWDAKAANREGRKPLTASAAPRMFLVLNAAVAQNDPGQPSPPSAAHVNWFTRRGWRKRYRHRHAQSCAPILSVGSGAHSRDHAVDRTGGSDLGAVPHR